MLLQIIITTRLEQKIKVQKEIQVMLEVQAQREKIQAQREKIQAQREKIQAQREKIQAQREKIQAQQDNHLMSMNHVQYQNKFAIQTPDYVNPFQSRGL
jgi:hypothetical protein